MGQNNLAVARLSRFYSFRMKSAQLATALIVPLMAWRIYVRVRRSIGPQPLQPRWLMARIIILSVLTILIGLAAVTHPPVLSGFTGGLLLGVPLAFLGLHFTKFETTPNGKFYTPNTAIGIGLSALFVGRIVYRFMVLSAAPSERDPSLPEIFKSPLTLLVFGITAGYYIAYYIGVFRKKRS
jgi:hypothetical protein